MGNPKMTSNKGNHSPVMNALNCKTVMIKGNYKVSSNFDPFTALSENKWNITPHRRVLLTSSQKNFIWKKKKNILSLSKGSVEVITCREMVQVLSCS